MEWMLHTVRNRRNMTDWTKVAEEASGTIFSMVIKPVERKIGKLIVQGFSYQYKFSSEKLAIYKITDRSSSIRPRFENGCEGKEYPNSG